MSNPLGGDPPKDYQFASGKSGNPGGRTPTKWMRELLSAACDKSPTGQPRRERIFWAFYWRALRCDPDTGMTDKSIPVKDANVAGQVLMAYDMGKPVAAVALTDSDGNDPKDVVNPLEQMVLGVIKKHEQGASRGEDIDDEETAPSQEPDAKVP
jgi:hypothetical protein